MNAEEVAQHFAAKRSKQEADNERVSEFLKRSGLAMKRHRVEMGRCLCRSFAAPNN